MNKRQETIINCITTQKSVSRSELANFIFDKNQEKVSQTTLLRDITLLLRNGFIKKHGHGRSVRYTLAITNPLFKHLNVDDYFKINSENRVLKSINFNFGIFEHLNGLFTKDELISVSNINSRFRKNFKKTTAAILKKEFERLTIEFSWKSSHIEGNTYTLLDTEMLIKEGIEAKGHKKEESIMILNHKYALDYIFQNPSYYKELTLSKIEELHKIIVDGLEISSGLRASPVGIIGTDYRPLDNLHQIRDAMHELVQILNWTKNPFEKAFISILMISYIQPFEDGNKRTSRILSNAILLAHDYCPLSYRSIDELEYKKAVIIFYEQNSARYLKELFLEQFSEAVKGYF
jgi:fido (protein-threonine AMPylation protein)